jgi:hypothetical protein
MRKHTEKIRTWIVTVAVTRTIEVLAPSEEKAVEVVNHDIQAVMVNSKENVEVVSVVEAE